MQRRNTIMIWVVSILIIIFTSVSVSPQLRIKIRQFIGDDTADYYFQSIKITNINGTSSEFITHSIVNLNDHFIGYSKQLNKMVKISTENNLSSYVNLQTQNCSACHQGSQQLP